VCSCSADSAAVVVVVVVVVVVDKCFHLSYYNIDSRSLRCAYMRTIYLFAACRLCDANWRSLVRLRQAFVRMRRCVAAAAVDDDDDVVDVDYYDDDDDDDCDDVDEVNEDDDDDLTILIVMFC
jgi:preprotein translocase subunit Sec63